MLNTQNVQFFHQIHEFLEYNVWPNQQRFFREMCNTFFMLLKVAGLLFNNVEFFWLKIEIVFSYYPRGGCIRSIQVWKLSWQSFYALTLLSAQDLHHPTSQIEIPPRWAPNIKLLELQQKDRLTTNTTKTGWHINCPKQAPVSLC